MDSQIVNQEGQIFRNAVETILSNCRDCYRCVRACPVKAIKISNAQAHIVDELCVHCGTCVRECPKQAKVTVSELDTVKDMLQAGDTVVASVAPSFAALFDGWKALRLPAALRMLGFSHVSETAEGAEQVSIRSVEKKNVASICTACPSVVNYIEKYRPEYIEMMIPVTSPMVMHGRMLKKRYGEDCKVVFIGPCVAKKQEALRPENRNAIDAVLTFEELEGWFAEEGIDLATCPESGFESFGDLSRARLFPIQGGMLKTCHIDCDNTELSVLHVSGAENVIRLLDIPPQDWGYDIVEPLFCENGCINGPCFHEGEEELNVFQLKNSVISYAKKAVGMPDASTYEDVDFSSHFRTEDVVDESPVDEEAINKVYESTGKSNPDLRLNCGACGYSSCREKAIAVVRGMAEPEMCIPHMRRLAQQRTDKIIESSPNGVVILDSELNMIHMNEAFQKLFMCSNQILGRRISYLINADGFEKLAVGAVDTFEAIRTKYGKKYHEILYRLPEEDQYVGMYTDISGVKFNTNQFDLIKRQTIEHAQELLDHQIRFSQEMAHYLGKSTAQNEEMLRKLMELYGESEQ